MHQVGIDSANAAAIVVLVSFYFLWAWKQRNCPVMEQEEKEGCVRVYNIE